jgi:FdhE protein
MTELVSPAQARQRVEDAVNGSREQIPEMSNVLDAFKSLLMERAALKAELSTGERIDPPSVDKEKFQSGVPVSNKEYFQVSAEDLKMAAARLIPAMKSGFPKIAEHLSKIDELIREERLNVGGLIQAVLQGKDREIEEASAGAEVDHSVMKFVLNQLLKPFAEKRSDALGEMVEKMEWHKGYCPLCGSWPELTYIEGQEGRRWLKCSFCGHEWRYTRTACPFCENSNTDELEVYYSEDREFERAELCHSCERYIVGIDLRDRTEERIMEVIMLRLFYLDILAQEKGFQPGALPGSVPT